MLADLGFTRVTTITARASDEEQGSAAFMAPELLLSSKYGLEKGAPSKEADIYALGMTMYQVFTGKWPFFPQREVEVMFAVLSGNRPTKPCNAEEIGMTDVLWNLAEGCWMEDRTKRPDVSNILGRICGITGERITTDSADTAEFLQENGRCLSVRSQFMTASTCSSGEVTYARCTIFWLLTRPIHFGHRRLALFDTKPHGSFESIRRPG
jgi:serine/threonine protein kinase